MTPSPGDPSGGRAFEEALERLAESDLDTRCAGVADLAKLDDDRATRALVELLDEASWFLRDRVVDALVDRQGVTSALLIMLREGPWYARASACDAIGRRGDLAAVPVLIEQVEDRNVSLQKSAVEALQALAATHGSGLIARAIAGLPPDRRRRVVARVGHQSPHWSDGLDRSLAALPPEVFACEVGTASGEPVSRRSSRDGSAPLVRFRKWLTALPARDEE